MGFCSNLASACQSAWRSLSACRLFWPSTRCHQRLVGILERLHAHNKYLSEQIGEIDREMSRQLAEDNLGQRLLSIPGVGPPTTPHSG